MPHNSTPCEAMPRRYGDATGFPPLLGVAPGSSVCYADAQVCFWLRRPWRQRSSCIKTWPS
eukprot:3646006-Pyramimonas_sp.AAC.1